MSRDYFPSDSTANYNYENISDNEHDNQDDDSFDLRALLNKIERSQKEKERARNTIPESAFLHPIQFPSATQSNVNQQTNNEIQKTNNENSVLLASRQTLHAFEKQVFTFSSRLLAKMNKANVPTTRRSRTYSDTQQQQQQNNEYEEQPPPIKIKTKERQPLLHQIAFRATRNGDVPLLALLLEADLPEVRTHDKNDYDQRLRISEWDYESLQVQWEVLQHFFSFTNPTQDDKKELRTSLISKLRHTYIEMESNYRTWLINQPITTDVVSQNQFIAMHMNDFKFQLDNRLASHALNIIEFDPSEERIVSLLLRFYQLCAREHEFLTTSEGVCDGLREEKRDALCAYFSELMSEIKSKCMKLLVPNKVKKYFQFNFNRKDFSLNSWDFLIKGRIAIDIVDADSSDTLLHVAIDAGRKDVVLFLTRQGINTEKKNAQGKSAAALANNYEQQQSDKTCSRALKIGCRERARILGHRTSRLCENVRTLTIHGILDVFQTFFRDYPEFLQKLYLLPSDRSKIKQAFDTNRDYFYSEFKLGYGKPAVKSNAVAIDNEGRRAARRAADTLGCRVRESNETPSGYIASDRPEINSFVQHMKDKFGPLIKDHPKALKPLQNIFDEYDGKVNMGVLQSPAAIISRRLPALEEELIKQQKQSEYERQEKERERQEKERQTERADREEQEKVLERQEKELERQEKELERQEKERQKERADREEQEKVLERQEKMLERQQKEHERERADRLEQELADYKKISLAIDAQRVLSQQDSGTTAEAIPLDTLGIFSHLRSMGIFAAEQDTILNANFMGLTFQKVPGDGHCLFHAIALYLGQDASFLRRIVAARMKADLTEFKNYWAGSNEAFEGHIQDVFNGQEWGDHLEIEVIQRITEQPIIIIRPDANPIIPDNINEYTGDPIFVYFDGRTHYDAFVVKADHQPRDILAAIQARLQQGEQIRYSPIIQFLTADDDEMQLNTRKH